MLCLLHALIRIVSEAAKVLGKHELSQYYKELGESIRNAIEQEYFTPSGRLAVKTQTAHVIALLMDLAPQHKERTIKDLKGILIKDGLKLKTGFLGTPHLCRVLSENGAHGYACRIFFGEEMPGWLYEVKMGATTIWERWNSVLPDGSISDTGMNSLNHYSYGSIAAWMYRHLVGISPIEPGWRKVRLTPKHCGELSYAKAEVLSPLGAFKFSWERDSDGGISVMGEVPFGARAELVLEDGVIEVEAGGFFYRIEGSGMKEDPARSPIGQCR
jgi:alpha-L-rhamnosidase